MRCIDQAVSEFLRVEEIATVALSSIKIIKESNETHSKLISQKHEELRKKADKLPLSSIEQTLFQILTLEKEKSEIKSSFLKLNVIPSLEEIIERNKTDLKLFRDKGIKLHEEDSRLCEQIEKLKKKPSIGLSTYCKIQGLANRRKEVFKSKENQFDEYFREIVNSINGSLENINHEINRFCTFTQQFNDRDQFKLLLNTNEDANLSLGIFKSMAYDELNNIKETPLKLIDKRKIKIKEFLNGWKEAILFVFPSTLIVALADSKINDIQYVTDFRYETSLYEFDINKILVEKDRTKIKIENKKKSLLDVIFNFGSVQLKFETEEEMENLLRELSI